MSILSRKLSKVEFLSSNKEYCGRGSLLPYDFTPAVARCFGNSGNWQSELEFENAVKMQWYMAIDATQSVEECDKQRFQIWSPLVRTFWSEEVINDSGKVSSGEILFNEITSITLHPNGRIVKGAIDKFGELVFPVAAGKIDTMIVDTNEPGVSASFEMNASIELISGCVGIYYKYIFDSDNLEAIARTLLSALDISSTTADEFDWSGQKSITLNLAERLEQTMRREFKITEKTVDKFSEAHALGAITNCSNCGATLKEGGKFCGACGHPTQRNPCEE